MQYVLAGIEGGTVDESPVFSLEDLPVAVQLADVESVAQDVRECRAIETRLALAEDMTFTLELVRERLECVAARGVQLEDADQGRSQRLPLFS